MIKAKGKLEHLSGVAFCFLASVAIAFIALNIGLKTEPGQILPTGISMRSGEMSRNILRGIDLAVEDINLIRSGNSSSGIWSLLTFVHMDLFFYLALILPQAAAKTVLLTGYYIRFGLCCSAMYYFMSRHIKLSRFFSALLAVMYTFSSQIVFTAQFASVMNMAVMIPVVMSSFDSYLQKRTWKSYILVCISSASLAISGGFGVITGIPAMVFTGLLMCISLYSTFKMAFTSWLKLIGGLIAGLLLSSVFVLPGMLSMKIDINVSESFKNAKVSYTVFELIRGTFLLRSGSIYKNAAPLFYVGILTFIAVIAFALNERIPVRLKVASAVTASVFHIMCCSSFVNETVSIFGTSSVLIASRLICLEIVLFFIAGIGLKNTGSLKRGEYIAMCLIPLFFLVMSGNSTSGTSFASSIVISTFLGIVLEASLVYAVAGGKVPRKVKYVLLAAVFAFVGVNTAFIMFNNSIQKKAAEEYFKVDNGSQTAENLIYDSEFEIPVFGNSDKYLLVPADLNNAQPGDSLIDSLNYISVRSSGEKLFEEIYLRSSDKRTVMQEDPGIFLLNEGSNELSFSPFIMEPGERLFIYCNAVNGADIAFDSPNGPSEKVFTAPFLTEIESGPGEISLKFMVGSDGEDACRIALYKINGTALEAMRALSGDIRGSGFEVDVRNVDGTCTLILPFAYDDTKITVNGLSCDTFGFSGKLSVTFVRNNENSVAVTVGRSSPGLIPGVVLSSFTALCLIAIPLFQSYNKKEKVTGEGTGANA